ncbi:Flp pilus assembly protein TadB [Sphingopyxis panaciterrae]|uniref:hypothetical protein n=1 Tax=Sphingopyxis panaciterrae TaxID=363841 RepID=UPI0014210A2E|nr:hypothetical protein [Sphingopyxis panaciterrae]NIJ36892.1 Flp pilus assembly protein TadB [Sphingopyxis panaciterrae]
MTNIIDDDSLRSLWRQSDTAPAPLPLAEIKLRATAFRRAIGKRNRREYVATAFVTLIFGLYALILPEPLLKIGSLLIIVGGLAMAWQLARRTARPDPAAEAADVRSYYHTQLTTEARMLASVGIWYLGPMLPGLAVFMAGIARASGFGGMVGFVVFAAVPAFVFLGIWLLNRRAAAMLREQIDQLDDAPRATEGETI